MQSLIQYYTEQYTMWYNKFQVTGLEYDKQQALSFLADLQSLTK